MSYHHPYVVANRMAQLDNMTRGRVMFGTGPGKLPVDAYMMGISTAVQRRRQGEAIDACSRLLRGEVVNMETDWFVLRDAQLQLMPYKGPGTMEMLAASLSSPSGPMLAGKYGLSLFSLSGGTPESFATLDTNWKAYEDTCHQYGHTPRREKWRVMGPMFLGETHQEVDRAISRRLPPNVEYIADVVRLFFPDNVDWMDSAQKTIDRWRSDIGIPLYGKGVFGPPVEAIREIERLWDKSGGFGGFTILVRDLADYEATRRSFELFAEEVIPHFRAYRNRGRAQSLHYVNTNVEKLYKPVAADGVAAREDYARSRAEKVHSDPSASPPSPKEMAD